MVIFQRENDLTLGETTNAACPSSAGSTTPAFAGYVGDSLSPAPFLDTESMDMSAGEGVASWSFRVNSAAQANSKVFIDNLTFQTETPRETHGICTGRDERLLQL